MDHEILPPTSLLAAFELLPDPTAIVDASGALLFANAVWQQRPIAQGTPPQPQPESIADSLRLRWGAAAESIAEGLGACEEVCHGTVAERELGWSPAGSPVAYRLNLRAIDGRYALAVVKKVPAVEPLAAEPARVQQQLEQALAHLNCFAEVSSETLVVSERGKVLFANAAIGRMFQVAPETAIGMSILDFTAPECRAEVATYLMKNDNVKPYDAIGVRADGSRFSIQIRARVMSYHGRTVRGAAVLDTSELNRTEALLRQKVREEERARTQSETLLALSTPIIPISEDVLVIPLIGAMDGERMERVTEILLDGIAARRAHFMIIDVTGLPTLDSATASGLVRVVRGVRLLGTQVILSGVRAEVAQELVRLGTDLSSLTIRSSLQSAVGFALGHGASRRHV